MNVGLIHRVRRTLFDSVRNMRSKCVISQCMDARDDRHIATWKLRSQGPILIRPLLGRLSLRLLLLPEWLPRLQPTLYHHVSESVFQ
jgi:hypothetical protein